MRFDLDSIIHSSKIQEDFIVYEYAKECKRILHPSADTFSMRYANVPAIIVQIADIAYYDVTF